MLPTPHPAHRLDGSTRDQRVHLAEHHDIDVPVDGEVVPVDRLNLAHDMAHQAMDREHGTSAADPATQPPAGAEPHATPSLTPALQRLFTALTATLAAARQLPPVSYHDTGYQLGLVLSALRSQLHTAHTLAHVAFDLDRDRAGRTP